METTTVPAYKLRSGDKIPNGNQILIVTYVALLRGLEIEVKYRYQDLSMRSLGEKRMVTPKNTLFKIVL